MMGFLHQVRNFRKGNPFKAIQYKYYFVTYFSLTSIYFPHALNLSNFYSGFDCTTLTVSTAFLAPDSSQTLPSFLDNTHLNSLKPCHSTHYWPCMNLCFFSTRCSPPNGSHQISSCIQRQFALCTRNVKAMWQCNRKQIRP